MCTSTRLWLWRRLATVKPNSVKSFIHMCRDVPVAVTMLEKHGSKTVEVFWDMENKPPLAMAPMQAAKGLKDMASRFGTVVDVVVYASNHLLKHSPSWSQERQQRRARGVEVMKEAEVHLCDYCGRRYRSNYALQIHFKKMHEIEHEKRVAMLGSMKKKGKRNTLLRIRMEKKETRFEEVVKRMFVPDKGYGLAAELQRGGMEVMTVSNKPKAALLALHRHMKHSIEQGVNCVWLISHNSLFLEVLKLARERQLHTIVITQNPRLQKCSDICFTWLDLVSHLPMVDINNTAYLWSLQDSLRGQPPHNHNFMTAELANISAREDMKAAQDIHNLEDDQNLDQFESTSDSPSDSSDAYDFGSIF